MILSNEKFTNSVVFSKIAPKDANSSLTRHSFDLYLAIKLAYFVV